MGDRQLQDPIVILRRNLHEAIAASFERELARISDTRDGFREARDGYLNNWDDAARRNWLLEKENAPPATVALAEREARTLRDDARAYMSRRPGVRWATVVKKLRVEGGGGDNKLLGEIYESVLLARRAMRPVRAVHCVDLGCSPARARGRAPARRRRRPSPPTRGPSSLDRPLPRRRRWAVRALDKLRGMQDMDQVTAVAYCHVLDRGVMASPEYKTVTQIDEKGIDSLKWLARHEMVGAWLKRRRLVNWCVSTLDASVEVFFFFFFFPADIF